ncbi:MAG: hypothetical protein JST47_16040 [Bacteroidetes bacterium]|nr:hypothetical protein [Bacteroidota bacterium]MBS1973500.1 hypothetical protein [Bacteroidota bacterium]
MNKEIRSIIGALQTVLNGSPWYGASVSAILDEAGKTNVFRRPEGKYHSPIELLYHMITWSEFALTSMRQGREQEITNLEKLDWRAIDPKAHNWEKAVMNSNL